MRLRRFQQSRFHRTKFRPEKTVVGTVDAARATLAPKVGGTRENAFCERQDALYVEFIELAGVTVDPCERELVAQFLGVAVVGVDVD